MCRTKIEKRRQRNLKERRTLEEMNEQYKDCSEVEKAYEIDGCKYVVHRHFVGTKNLDEVMEKLAFEYALNNNSVTA